MTDKEKAIVMAYTGICMLAGDKFRIFHKYVEDIMGKPIYTHEIGLLADTIKEKSEADFMALCADESTSEIPNKWIPVSEGLPDIHNYCMKYLVTDCHGHINTSLFTESGGKGWWSREDVAAWQPLPEPYRAESEDAE